MGVTSLACKLLCTFHSVPLALVSLPPRCNNITMHCKMQQEPVW